MKKILLILLCVVLLAVCFFACRMKEEPSSQPEPPQSEESSLPEEYEAGSPAAVAARFLDALSALDKEEIAATISNTESGWLDGLTEPDPREEAYLELARAYLKRMSYSLRDTSIDGDTALVEVAISVPDLTGVINDMVTELIKQSAMSALKGEKPDYEAMMAEYLRDVDMSKLNFSDTLSAVPLVRENGGAWLVDSDSDRSESLLNAISGGVLEKLESFSEQIDGFAG